MHNSPSDWSHSVGVDWIGLELLDWIGLELLIGLDLFDLAWSYYIGLHCIGPPDHPMGCLVCFVVST